MLPGFELPWHYKDKDIAVAITGKALKFMAENKDKYDYELKSVLHRAKVYARMSPDDKAMLV
jgi:magnesium-transporting ATPase (P-type)